ncbi:hypothetical protein SPRG_04763 [Saprolegnia parasitica CBS 223.65]|uniref:PH domain-containing protein n=1 Tax=Saprolegnia parasitica (strain CBS 223.65) TaxID=695850 RepID=A0A067CWF9_SAPPC|nr:hypothetical protein SPRG_04763 [Saprolegnia parasitica CBS 223.65]KDO30861.1 hypothetical protein SPRG_04763 [Saprolegnia parasitica CBS 223.65]|eukprot:XP_012198556.1 hypothetical protein SPRG_04763 [Saprolegnia parasitica CBS 223.65]
MTTKRIYHGVDINVLEGWLVKYNSKEKFFGSSCNKRWFKVDVANPEDHVSMHRLILSYFKAKKAKEVRGWIYLEDVTKINVKPNLIEIASPSRTLRVKGETTAEHKLWADSLQALRFPPPPVLPKSTAIVPSSLMATFERVDDASKELAAAAKAPREAKGEIDAKAERKSIAEPLVDRERKSYSADVKPSARSLPPPGVDSDSSGDEAEADDEDEADAKEVAAPARSTTEVKHTSEPRAGPKAHLTATEPLQFSDSEDENDDDASLPAKRSLARDVDEPAPSPKVDAANDSDDDDDDNDRFHDAEAPERHLSTEMKARNNAPPTTTDQAESDDDGDDDSVGTTTRKHPDDVAMHDAHDIEDDDGDRNQEPPAQIHKRASAYFDDEEDEEDEARPSKASPVATTHSHPGTSAVAADNNFVTEDWDQDDAPVKASMKAERQTGGVAADANFAHADWDD